MTSIATGITTVALLEQAPKSVTQTINRVIQQTVENVVTGETEIKTIVIKEEDLIVDAISLATPSIVSVYDGELVIQQGTVIENGTKVLVNSTLFVEGSMYSVKEGEKNIQGKYTASTKGYGVITLETPSTIKGLRIGDKEARTGQSGIILVGTSAFPGKVTGITNGETSTLLKWNNTLEQSYVGAPVINTDGIIIGLVIKSGESVSILSAHNIK